MFYKWISELEVDTPNVETTLILRHVIVWSNHRYIPFQDESVFFDRFGYILDKEGT